MSKTARYKVPIMLNVYNFFCMPIIVLYSKCNIIYEKLVFFLNFIVIE